MKINQIVSLLAAAALSLPLLASDPGKSIELKDGTRVVLHTDGKTMHIDANGKRIRMKDGVVMEGKDGEKYLMKNDAIWKQITEKGSLAPNR